MNRYDDDDMPLTDADYDGVVYEPSIDNAQPPRKSNSQPPSRKPSGSSGSSSVRYSSAQRSKTGRNTVKNISSAGSYPKNRKSKKNQKSQYKIFMLLTVLTGIVICIVAFAVVFNAVSGSPDSVNTTDPTALLPQGDEITKELEENKIGTTITGVIKIAEYEKNQFVILSFDDNKNFTLKTTGSTELKDTYDNSMTIEEFKVGNIVDFVYDKDKKLTSLRLSSSGFTKESVTGVKINTDNRTIKLGDNSYSYSELLSVTYKGEASEVSKIDELDRVTLSGYNNTVYSINIEKGHGIIQIKNKEKIKDGSFQVDKNVYKNLDEVGSIKVTEGDHQIIVKGSNCDTLTKDISVEADQTVDVDLNEVNIKTGILLINSNVSDYLLTINDSPELSREPLTLEYGAYNIKVEKEGYTSFEKQIVLNSAQQTIEVKLETEVKSSNITVNSTPSGAEVYVDNAKIGYTPVTASITQGKHSISVQMDGYVPVTYTGIDITEKDNIYNINLQKDTSSQPAETTTQAAQTENTQ